jgi:hypothetical protein
MAITLTVNNGTYNRARWEVKKETHCGWHKIYSQHSTENYFFLLVISILQQSLKGNLMCTDILTYKRMVIDEGCTDIYSVWKFEIFVLL